MKGIIYLDFKRINRQKIDAELLKNNPKLVGVTEKVMGDLCIQVKKYFHEHKIELDASSKIEPENDKTK